MTKSQRKPWYPWASASSNGDFISVKTYSGYNLQASDPKGKEIFLSPEADDASLGQVVLEALNASRMVGPKDPDWDTFFDYQLRAERYKEWVEATMQRFGYKTKRALFKRMHNCDIEVCDNLMTISPSHHEKLEGWSGFPEGENKDVIIPADSSAAEVGAALRLAFSRCTGGF